MLGLVLLTKCIRCKFTHLSNMFFDCSIPRLSPVKVQPVGGNPLAKFLALTELPPPKMPSTLRSMRRHLEDCGPEKSHREVYSGAKVHIFGDYYDDKLMMTVATIIFPDHIDHKHFEVTTQAPYFTVGPIGAIGFNPQIPDEVNSCEKIYLDHLSELYSDESADKTEESLEIAHIPSKSNQSAAVRPIASDVYSDLE